MVDIKPDEKIVFGVSPDGEGGDGYVLLLGVTDKAWNYCKDGKTHTVDLTAIGLPIRLVLFGARTQADVVKMINQHNSRVGVDKVLDATSHDFSVKDGTVSSQELKQSVANPTVRPRK